MPVMEIVLRTTRIDVCSIAGLKTAILMVLAISDKIDDLNFDLDLDSYKTKRRLLVRHTPY